jgi:hypothetical protein
MKYLPFYDEGAIRTLRNFEAAVYRELVWETLNAKGPQSIYGRSVDSNARVSATTRSWNFGSLTSAEPCVLSPCSS